jgi:PPOX class probable F420-dependent enzyme
MPSRRDLVRMTDEEIDAFLHAPHQTMNVATYNHDGTIHLVAMWYGFYEGKPAFETFTKSQKVLNLRRDNRISVLIEDGKEYEKLRGLELVGTADVIDDPNVVMEVARTVVSRYFEVAKPEDIDAIAAGLARKRSAIVIDAERTVSWDHNKLGGTY